MKLLDAQCAPECVMTKYVAPAEPTGRWRQYNEAYREINENAFFAEFPEALAPYAARTTVVEKSTYSSLDAPEVLAAMEGKKAVVLAGVVADCCVLATMMDAIDLGYEVVYLYDCIAGVSEQSEAEIRALAELTGQVVARSGVTLLIYDPVEKTMEGFPLRLVRLTETNLGDFCADVLRCGTGADIGLISGGSIRADLPKGDITYGDIMSVWPYENDMRP